MSISINCKLSLSKKLRALLGREASLTLVSQDLVDGKGTAILSLNSSDFNGEINPEEMGETSIMLIPVEMADESPNTSSPVHASIFSSVPPRHKEEKVVQKLAAVHAPEKKEVSRSIKEKAEVPEAFSELKQEECKTWIKNMEELVAAVSVARNKKSDIDVDSAQNERDKAILQQMKEKEESIDIPAWIINDKVGMLSVNDLDIALPMNIPYDLSNIPAKRISMSKDLRGLIREGYVRFLSPIEKDQIILKVTGEAEEGHTLDVFDNHEQAMDNMGGTSRNPVIDDENSMTITEQDINEKTEDESMILNLTQNAPTIKNSRPAPDTNRTTSHRNTPATPKNPNIKTVRKVTSSE